MMLPSSGPASLRLRRGNDLTIGFGLIAKLREPTPASSTPGTSVQIHLEDHDERMPESRQLLDWRNVNHGGPVAVDRVGRGGALVQRQELGVGPL